MTEPVKPGFKQVFKAVFGAFIGVQSAQQRQLDFNSTSPMPYIVAGILMALLFVGGLLLVVNLVIG